MTKYRSKPVEIEAFQWVVSNDLITYGPGWFTVEVDAGRVRFHDAGSDPAFGIGPFLELDTANGPVRARNGDWIIREPSGIGCYPCKDEVFQLKYEPV